MLMLSSTDVLLFTTSNLGDFDGLSRKKQYQMLTETKTQQVYCRWQYLSIIFQFYLEILILAKQN